MTFGNIQKLCVNIYICFLYMSSVIGRIYTYNRSVIQYWWSCTPSHSIGLYFWGERSWMPLFVFFGLPIVPCSMMNSLTLGCLWPLVFVLNYFLILGIWCSVISHLPGCFCPWTIFQNIGFNMVPSDPFMSHLATQLGNSENNIFTKNGTYVEKYTAGHLCTKFEEFILISEAMIAKMSLTYFWL